MKMMIIIKMIAIIRYLQKRHNDNDDINSNKNIRCVSLVLQQNEKKKIKMITIK